MSKFQGDLSALVTFNHNKGNFCRVRVFFSLIFEKKKRNNISVTKDISIINIQHIKA